MNFNQWWYEIGSGIVPLANDDMESHAKRIASIAWRDGMLQAALISEGLYRYDTPNGVVYMTGNVIPADCTRAIREAAQEMK